MSCLFHDNAFSVLAPISGLRYSFPFFMLCLVSVLWVPDFLSLSLVASRETFLFPHCQPLV